MYAVRVGTLFYRVNLAGDISKLLIISELKTVVWMHCSIQKASVNN